MFPFYQMCLGRENENLYIGIYTCICIYTYIISLYTQTHMHKYIHTYIKHIYSILGTSQFLFSCFHHEFSVHSGLFCSELYFIKSWLPWRQNKVHLVPQHVRLCSPLNTSHQWSFIYTFQFSKIPCSHSPS